MARDICLKPCVPTQGFGASTVTIPLMGSQIIGAGNLSLQGGCSNCEIASNILLQLNVLLGGLGIPLCVLGCLASVIAAVQAVPDSLGPPPNPVKLVTAIANIAIKCECVLGFALPPPAGVICDFIQLIADILTVLDVVVDCLVGLITSILALNIQATLLLTGPPASQQAAACLLEQLQLLMDGLNSNLGSLSTLIQAIQPVIQFLATVPGLSTVLNPLIAGFAALTAATPQGTAPQAFLAELTTFQSVLDSVTTAFQTIAEICP
jgi:hypothetical protein